MQLNKPIVISEPFSDGSGREFLKFTYQFNDLPFNINVNKFHDFMREKEEEATFTYEKAQPGKMTAVKAGNTLSFIIELTYEIDSGESEDWEDDDEQLY
jgi:hypothetical protein